MKKVEEKLNAIDINSMVDFTLLDPRATYVDIEKVCDIAYKNQYYSVCVQPCNVQFASSYIAKNFESGLKHIFPEYFLLFENVNIF